MILNRLYEYAEHKQLMQETAFEEKAVPWILVLDRDGTPLALMSTKESPPEAEASGRKPRPRPKAYPVPKVQGKEKGGVATPCVDKASFVFGPQHWAKDEKQRRKFERDHAAFVRLATEVAEGSGDEGCRTVVGFLRRLDAGEVSLPQLESEKVKETDLVGFRLASDPEMPVFRRTKFREWWGKRVQEQEAEVTESGPKGVCLVTGFYGPIAKTHTTKIMGIPDGQPSGTVLVGMDKDAFQSYGFEASLNGPVCPRVAEAYARGLNHLIRDEPHSIRTQHQVTVIWSRNPAVQSLIEMMKQGVEDVASLWRDEGVEAVVPSVPVAQEDLAREDLKAPFKGRQGDTADPDAVYVLSLGANGGRAVVRDWIETRLRVAQENLRRWFEDLAIVDTSGNLSPRRPGLYALANATGREPRDVSPSTEPALIRAAFEGTPVPPRILVACLQRLHAERNKGFTLPRMALVKLTLNRLRKQEGKEDLLMEEALQPNLKDAAYHCGRLFAVYAHIQWRALGDVGATVVDKFYGTASVTPLRVFKHLDDLAMKHLRKLRDKSPGSTVYYERLIDNLHSKVTGGFPARLSAKEQGSFVLGFHHQRAELRRKRTDEGDTNETEGRENQDE